MAQSRVIPPVGHPSYSPNPDPQLYILPKKLKQLKFPDIAFSETTWIFVKMNAEEMVGYPPSFSVSII